MSIVIQMSITTEIDDQFMVGEITDFYTILNRLSQYAIEVFV